MSRARTLAAFVLGITAVAAASPAAAQMSGQVQTTMTLDTSCEVNGSAEASSVNFGTLDFGHTTALFNTASAQVQGSGGGGIQIQCSPDAQATLTVTGGLYDGSGANAVHAMSDGTNFVSYDLYTDAGLRDVLANNAAIPVVADGEVHAVAIYGQAFGASTLPGGSYVDTLSLTLTF